ncbi:MAG: FAD-binding protein [bacterium]
METIKTQVLIIGGGAAGLNTALNLNTSDTILIEKNTANSILSPWNMMIKSKKELKKAILKAGNKTNNLNLLNVFFKNNDQAIKDLKKIGIKLKKSNLGLIPDYTLPGLETRKIFLKKIKRKKIKLIKGEINNFLLNKQEKIKGVSASILNSNKKIKIFFNYLVLAGGGMGGFFPFKTGTNDSDGSILSLCYEAGFKMRDLEFLMFHPFLISDKRLPKLLISGNILTQMEYEDEKGKQFLSKEIIKSLKTNKHHSVFPQMTKEFYLQSLKSKIFGKLICSNEWFEKFKKENEFGFIFKNFKKDALKKIEIHPAFHFSIGGLVINKNSQTNHSNVYAAGEITGGLHGTNRIGGLAVLEALIFGKKAALNINEKIKKQTKKIIIPEQIKTIGKLDISDKIKNMAWQALGPVKNKKTLNDFKRYLEKKKKLTSQEKLLKKITEICLLRKESIGTFYRTNLKQKKTATASFLINNDIVFK